MIGKKQDEGINRTWGNGMTEPEVLVTRWEGHFEIRLKQKRSVVEIDDALSQVGTPHEIRYKHERFTVELAPRKYLTAINIACVEKITDSTRTFTC